MRRLIYLPDLHRPSETEVEPILPNALKEELDERSKRIWKLIADHVDASNLDFSRVRVYFESVSEEDVRLISETGALVTEDPGPEHLLLEELHKKGAVIEASEDPAIYERQTALQRVIVDAIKGYGGEASEDEKLNVLFERHDRIDLERDRAVAAIINRTLTDAEVGILFFGAGHNILAFLDPDITIEVSQELLAEIGRCELDYEQRFPHLESLRTGKEAII